MEEKSLGLKKHTGRARHGSTRSPIWNGGGISGGPRNEKVYEKTIPTKMRKKALFMVLSEKAKKNLLVVLDVMEMEKPKTKEMNEMVQKLPGAKDSRLVLYSKGNSQIFLAARNIERTGVSEEPEI